MPVESSRDQEALAEKGKQAYQDLVKEREHEDARREEQEAQAAEVQRFLLISGTMNKILGTHRDNRLTLELPEGLREEEKKALEWLHAARFGRDHEVAGYLSALERSQELNKALAVLQPVLSFALVPGQEEIRKSYAKVRGGLVKLKHEIKQAVMAELKRKVRKKPKKGEEEDEEDGDETDENDEENEGDGSLEIDDEVAQAKTKKMGVIKRLFRRDKSDSNDKTDETKGES